MATRPTPASGSTVNFLAASEIDAALMAEWDQLAAATVDPNPFAERWFLYSSCQWLETPASLRIAMVRDEQSQLIGCMPLQLHRRYGRMPLSHVRNWLHPNAFLGTPLVRAGAEQEFWRRLLDALDASPWAEGLLHLTMLAAQGPVITALKAECEARGGDCDVVHALERAELRSDLGAAAYYEATVRKKKRKEIKRLQARLAESGEVEAHILSDAEHLGSWIDAFLTLERSGWKGDSGSALGSNAATEGWFKELVQQGHAAGRVEMLRITLDGQPIAILVNFMTAPGSYSFKIAYDEDHARFSPGVLIQLENLKLLEREDVGWMDSCAVENHPMINSLWGERRQIVWVSVSLSGFRRRAAFRFARFVESSWATLKRWSGNQHSAANDNSGEAND